MRGVVVLALLWQTAVVLGLGAIHALDNNNNNFRATTSTLPWVGTEVWFTTHINNSFPTQVDTTGGELYLYVTGQSTCDERQLTFDVNDGSQTSSASFDACALYYFVQQLPFVAALVNLLDKGFGVKVFDVNSSSLAPIMSLPPLPSLQVALFPVGDHFFWFATDNASTTLTKIDPRARTSATAIREVPQASGFVAGLNHLFAKSPATNTVYCYSAATGDVIWTMSVTGSDVVKLVPAPSSDAVLLVFANYSTSLFNSATGVWVWTANVPVEIVGDGASLTAVFAATTVVLKMEFISGTLFNTTAVNVTSGKILWALVGGADNGFPRFSCVLKSNIFVASVTSDPNVNPKFSLIGLDANTGEKVLDYTPTHGMEYGVYRIYCHDDDVYFVTFGKYEGRAVYPIYTIVQRIAFAPRP